MMSGTTVRGEVSWDMPHLLAHLHDALALEFWTIPYYLATMYSIKDPASDAYRLLQSVVYQEMLHAQLVCNLTSAFGGKPQFLAPVYEGQEVPHLNFRLDEPDPTQVFSPYSAAIGPLDEARINTLCLIEYPQWRTGHTPCLQEDRTQYGSIGEFYDALRVGVTELRHHLQPNVNQVDYFGSYYNHLPATTISKAGLEGHRQAMWLLDVIVQQGEGQTRGEADIPPEYRNTADGYQDHLAHFGKFMRIRESRHRPATFEASVEAGADPGSAGQRAQAVLVRDFASFTDTLNALFTGHRPQGFGALMTKLGGDVLNCWKCGVVPRFS